MPRQKHYPTPSSSSTLPGYDAAATATIRAVLRFHDASNCVDPEDQPDGRAAKGGYSYVRGHLKAIPRCVLCPGLALNTWAEAEKHQTVGHGKPPGGYKPDIGAESHSQRYSQRCGMCGYSVTARLFDQGRRLPETRLAYALRMHILVHRDVANPNTDFVCRERDPSDPDTTCPAFYYAHNKAKFVRHLITIHNLHPNSASSEAEKQKKEIDAKI